MTGPDEPIETPQAPAEGEWPTRLRNVLVVRFSAIGDVAMTVPPVYNACMRYPSTHFYMLTRPSMVAIYVNPPANLTVIGADIKNKYKGVPGIARLFREVIDRHSVDAIIDLQSEGRVRVLRLIAALRRIPYAHIDKGASDKRALTRRADKLVVPLETSRQRYRNTFEAIGLPLPDTFNGLYGDSKAPAEAYAAITAPRPEGMHWVGIAPFALYPGKIYPIDMMEKVVAELSKRPDVRIFLFGGDGNEKAVLDQWAERYDNVDSLAGRHFGFDVELALVSNLDCMVCMDSANMHLAAISRIPVISIWGATHPYCGFMGWRQDETNMIQLPLTCRPCSVLGDKPCYRGDHLCLAGIQPRVILDRINAVL